MSTCTAQSAPFDGEEFQLECDLSADDPHQLHHFHCPDYRDRTIIYTILWQAATNNG